LFFIERQIIDVKCSGENISNRLAVSGGFLAYIQLHQMKAKDVDQSQQVLQFQLGNGLIAVADLRIAG